VKTAPHLGHLTFVSFAMLAHPKENAAKIPKINSKLTHFFIVSYLLLIDPLVPMRKNLKARNQGLKFKLKPVFL